MDCDTCSGNLQEFGLVRVSVKSLIYKKKRFIDKLEDCHANRTSNLMLVPHQLRRVRFGA